MSQGSRLKHVSNVRRALEESTAVVQPRDVVMVKLKAGPARAVAAAGARALAAGVPAPQPAGLVSRLVANGVVAEVAPVFSADPPQGRTIARASRRALAMEALSGGAFPVSAKRARGLTSLRIERGWNAAQVARDLMADPEVEYAYVPAVKYPAAAAKRPAKSKRPARRKRSNATGVDPLSARQWSHAAIHVHEARQRAGFRDAADVLVAIVDSGIDRQHPDLAAAIEHFVNFLAPAEDDRDYKGHGTHVAGIIAAVINNSIGIAGLCKARLAVLKALPRGGDWNAAAYYRALAHPIDLQAKVVNLSLGGSFDPGEEDVIRDLLDAGIVVVAAMGNEFQEGNATSYPAAYPGVIAVGATDEADRRASFSCTGPHIALMAPGERILSTVPTYPSELAATTSYDSWPGTSMATPHVVAAAALLLAKSPGLTPAEVKSRLAKSADRVKWQQSRPDDEYGWGRLNVLRALG